MQSLYAKVTVYLICAYLFKLVDLDNFLCMCAKFTGSFNS